MHVAATLSIVFHSAVILFAWLGAPSFRPLTTPEQLVEVELVAEATKPEPKPKSKPKPAVKPPPPPRQVFKPEPEAVPKPKPEAVPLPKLAEEPKPRPKPKLKPKPKPKQRVRRPRPKSKPKPPPKRNDFASVLKTVNKLKKTLPAKTKPKVVKRKPAPDFHKQMVAALKRKRPQIPRIGSVISPSELDAIRRQIEACWYLPAGARDAANMTVVIRTVMNPDGRVRSASIVDSGRASRDHFYRSMAESALRAVLNPRCQPLRLPLEKFDVWRVMVLNFDPREMF